MGNIICMVSYIKICKSTIFLLLLTFTTKDTSVRVYRHHRGYLPLFSEILTNKVFTARRSLEELTHLLLHSGNI